MSRTGQHQSCDQSGPFLIWHWEWVRMNYKTRTPFTFSLQAIALLDTLDKDVNTFIMRVREWYGWHFPELAKIVADNFQYARVVMLARNKSSISDEMIGDLKEIVGDQDVAEQVCMRLHAAV